MTTDTVPKEVAVKAGGFTVGGIAKGAGMIHPNMATMLCFIATDAAIDAKTLTNALRWSADKSFNMISVDGDTSTNDTVLVLANGTSGKFIKTGSANAALFQEALDAVCIDLAKAVARDGEGATRLIEVTVRGAKTRFEARDAARTIVSSSLVKTAIHGGDPNWGRVIAAAGRSKAAVEEGKLSLSMGGIPVLLGGAPLEFDRERLSSLIRQKEVVIDLNLNLGQAAATAWGCDLSAEYVSINADYTT
jgi:glutamate N-acetyltransferase/amino-acid N-acetyltransferase